MSLFFYYYCIDMALDYIIYFIILENMFQYSINLYHLTQIFCARQNNQIQEDVNEPESLSYHNRDGYIRLHCPI